MTETYQRAPKEMKRDLHDKVRVFPPDNMSLPIYKHMYTCVVIHTCMCTYRQRHTEEPSRLGKELISLSVCAHTGMGWLRLVGSSKI